MTDERVTDEAELLLPKFSLPGELFFLCTNSQKALAKEQN
jgi:hypothetical protein